MFGMDGETHPNRIWVEKKCVFRRTFKSKQRDSAHTHTQYKHKIGNEGKTTKIDNLFDCPRLIVSRSILQNPFSFPWQAMLFLSLAPMDVVAVNCVSSSAAKCRQAGRQAGSDCVAANTKIPIAYNVSQFCLHKMLLQNNDMVSRRVIIGNGYL